jgi:hypothetical protein
MTDVEQNGQTFVFHPRKGPMTTQTTGVLPRFPSFFDTGTLKLTAAKCHWSATKNYSSDAGVV